MLLVVGAIAEADAGRAPTFRSNGFARGTRGSNCVVPGTSSVVIRRGRATCRGAHQSAPSMYTFKMRTLQTSERKRILAAFIASSLGALGCVGHHEVDEALAAVRGGLALDRRIRR